MHNEIICRKRKLPRKFCGFRFLKLPDTIIVGTLDYLLVLKKKNVTSSFTWSVIWAMI